MLTTNLVRVLVDHHVELDLKAEDVVFLLFLLVRCDAHLRVQISVSRIATSLACDRRTVERRIDRLRERGFFQRELGTGNIAASFDFEPLPTKLRSVVPAAT